MLKTLHVLLHLSVQTVLVGVGKTPIWDYTLENQGSERLHTALNSKCWSEV